MYVAPDVGKCMERYTLICMWHHMQGNVWREIYTHMYVAPDVGKCMERDIHSYVCGTRCREMYGERYTLICMWHQMWGNVWREIYTHTYVAPDAGNCMGRDTHSYMAPDVGKCMERDIYTHLWQGMCGNLIP